jgi:hypothetical protein
LVKKKEDFMLMRFSGRDLDTLAECPADERAASSMLGLTLVSGAAAHWVGMHAALNVLNVPAPVAAGIATITAAGLLGVDRLAIRSADLQKGAAVLARIDGATAPPMSGVGDSLLAAAGRISFSVMTGASLSFFVALHFYDADMRAETALRQAVLDAPLIAAAEMRLQDRQAMLEDALAEALARQAQIEAAYKAQLQAQTDRAAAAAQRLDDLRQQRSDTQAELAATEAEAQRQRDLMACEIAGKGPGCEAASGTPGKGTQYLLAESRALAADVRADALRDRLRQIDDTLAAPVDAGPPPAGPLPESVEVTQARAALSDLADNHEEMIAAAARADPGRQVLSPDSLAERLQSLGALLQKPFVAAALLATALAAMAIELLPYLAAVMARPGDYALRRAAKLDATARAQRNLAAQQCVADETGLMAAEKLRRARRDRAAADRVMTRILPYPSRRNSAGGLN